MSKFEGDDRKMYREGQTENSWCVKHSAKSTITKSNRIDNAQNLVDAQQTRDTGRSRPTLSYCIH